MKTFTTSLTTILFYGIVLLISISVSSCFGQDTIKHYPELKKTGRNYLYGDKKINEKEMQTQLVLLGNAEITKQIQLAKKYKDLQGIGYWAIPLGLAATHYGIESQSVFWEPYDPQKEKISQVFYGATFLVLSSSVYFKIETNKKNAKALRLYKEYYHNQ